MNSHPDLECWDLHPDKMPAHIRERTEGKKKAAGGDLITEAAILDFTMQDSQQDSYIEQQESLSH